MVANTRRSCHFEDRIRRALEQRGGEGTTDLGLAILSNSTLSDHARGGKTRQQVKLNCQALTPLMEKALEKW